MERSPRRLACCNSRLRKINVEPGEGNSALKEGTGSSAERTRSTGQSFKALTGVSGVGGSNERSSLVHRSRKRKTMSADARKRIAAAQRARWSKWKAAQRTK